MRTNPEHHDRLSPTAERLSALASGELGHLSTAQKAAGLGALHARLNRRRGSLNMRPLAFALAAMVTLAALFVGRKAFQRAVPVQLAFEIDGVKSSSFDWVEATDRARMLRFSDGSELTVQPGARARLHSVSDKGAELALEDGVIGVRIVPRPNAAWSVNAGPFVIRVTGTVFTTEWAATAGRLLVRLERGSVTVSGPLSDGPIRLLAGQQLMIRLREREVVIRDLDEPLAASTVAAGIGATSETTLDAGVESDPPLAPVPSARSVDTSRPAVALQWSSELSAGNFDGIIRDAKSRGIEQVLGGASTAELSALADAARFAGEPDLARRALTSERQRFPKSWQARDAAFLLGRLEEVSGADHLASVWYDRYLAESRSGTYASDALGRKMLLVQKVNGEMAAREVAKEYLQRFPAGAYARTAKAIADRR